MEGICKMQRFINNLWNKIKQYYIDNIPTDKHTCDMLIPVISLIFSSLNLIILTSTYPYFNFFPAFCLIVIFLILTGSVTYQLYWGLKLEDRKQISLWIVLKLVENIASSILYIKVLCITSWYYFKWRSQFLFVAPAIIGFNLLLTAFVVLKSRQINKSNLNNVYAKSKCVPIDNEPLTTDKNAV